MIPGQSSPTTTIIAWLLVNPGIARRLKRMANMVSLHQMVMIMCQNRIQPNTPWSVPHTSVRSYFHDWRSIIPSVLRLGKGQRCRIHHGNPGFKMPCIERGSRRTRACKAIKIVKIPQDALSILSIICGNSNDSVISGRWQLIRWSVIYRNRVPSVGRVRIINVGSRRNSYIKTWEWMMKPNPIEHSRAIIMLR